jgi:hypothetical protein
MVVLQSSPASSTTQVQWEVRGTVTHRTRKPLPWIRRLQTLVRQEAAPLAPGCVYERQR